MSFLLIPGLCFLGAQVCGTVYLHKFMTKKRKEKIENWTVCDPVTDYTNASFYAQEGDLEKLKEITSSGNHIDFISCITNAARRGHVETVKWLSAQHPWRGVPGAVAAIESGNVEMMDEMDKLGYRFRHPETLNWAITKGSLHGVKLFLKQGGTLHPEDFGVLKTEAFRNDQPEIYMLFIENKDKMVDSPFTLVVHGCIDTYYNALNSAYRTVFPQ